MLTKENAHSWSPRNFYPTYRWVGKDSIKFSLRDDGADHQELEKQGYVKEVVFKNEDDDFADYCDGIKQEHNDLSDDKMLASPTGIFHGRGRNARWMDEILRRNLR